jgi:hypothetical protein
LITKRLWERKRRALATIDNITAAFLETRED